MKYDFEEEKNIIINNLEKIGYSNRLIIYEEFLELYEPYKAEMSEMEFAHILGISSNSYRNMKNAKNKARILKSKFYRISEKRKTEIREELCQKGLSDKKITYEEFLKLYEAYKDEISKSTFALILDITQSNYDKMKRENRAIKILRQTHEEVAEERKKEIENELIQKGLSGKRITYEEFLELYEPYKEEMEEKLFASIIGIKISQYSHMKNGRCRAGILKQKLEKVTEERKAEIREELVKKGFSNHNVTYEEFLKLYEQYREEMSEIDFANILEIGIINYRHMKDEGKTITILKMNFREVTEERKQEINRELISRGLANKLISYKEFLELYQEYKQEMSERKFAEIIGIGYSTYTNIRSTNIKSRILKQKFKETSKERWNEIKEELIGRGLSNFSITYEEFLKLYEKYKGEMSEIDFAEILEIKYSSWRSMRGGNKVRILKQEKKISEDRINQIREKLRKKGLSNKKIVYEEFLELYEKYKGEMTEVDFAEVLGISYTCLHRHEGWIW